MVKNYIFQKIIFLSFLNHIYLSIVLPLYILPRENYKLIYPSDSPADIIDNENRKLFYTILEIGSPIQYIPLLIKPKSNFFTITSVHPFNNTYNNEYKAFNFSKNFLEKYDFYNENMSTSAKWNWCRESEYYNAKQCCSINDDILFYEDVNMTNYTKKIDFEIMRNVDDNITGEIGLYLYNRDGRIYNTFLGVLKNNKLIDNLNFYFDFDSPDEDNGKLVIGSWPHEDYPLNYLENDLMVTNSYISSIIEFMQIKFNEVYTIENKDEYEEEIYFSEEAELLYDSNLIFADNKYKIYLFNKLNDLLVNKQCFIDIIKNFDTFGNSTFIYCKNERYIKDKLNSLIKPIFFLSNDFNYTLEITSEEIIKEKNNLIFIHILFRDFSRKWSLGKIFSLKYKFTFNQESKQIGFYRDTFLKKEKSNQNIKKILIICSIFILCVILIVLGIVIGKYLNKTRKKRANELMDEYEYVEDNKNEKSINNVFIDDKNIN